MGLMHTTICERLLEGHLLPRCTSHPLSRIDTRISLDGALQRVYPSSQTRLMLLWFGRRRELGCSSSRNRRRLLDVLIMDAWMLDVLVVDS